MNRTRSVLGALGCVAALAAGPVRAGEPIDYNRDIRPILSDRCFACHGPDKNHRKADLRLDVRDAALEHEAFVPGKPDESELVSRVFSDDPDELMPPRSMNKPLTDAQKDLLKRWVAAGAPYADHWAYTPIRRPPVPKPKEDAKVRNPIDGFLQANLEAHKVAPSPEADRRALLRRLSLDLTGLPPTPGEVRTFVDDKGPRAYETQVERLLASPRYGERMAVPWLDVVRYADTVGFHGDQNQNVWAYRDYVIDAFNTNKPFDRFTTEQLAGDLLPDPTAEQLVATCFNRLNMVTREGGAQPKEYLARYAADRVRTVAMTWLGSTLGCAECHDHKFDPISARDFYSLSAFFADMKQWGVYSEYVYTPNPDLRGYTNDHPFPPEIVVESPALKRRISELRDEITRVVSQAGDPPKEEFTRWRESSLVFLKAHPDGWEAPAPTVNRVAAPPKAKGKASKKAASKPPAGEPGAFSVRDDGVIAFTGKDATNNEIILRPAPGQLAAVRLELLPDAGKLLRPGAAEAALRLSAEIRPADGSRPRPLTFRAADADRAAPRYRNGAEILGVRDAWRIDAALNDAARPLTGVWLLDSPVTLREGDTLAVRLLDSRAARAKISVSPFAPEDLKKSAFGDDFRAALERDDAPPAVRAAYLRSTSSNAPALASLAALEAQIRECRDGRTPVLVTQAVKPAVTRLLPRGNWQDESGPVVEPAVLHFLPQPKNPSGGRLNRLDLARWITAPENPLTARVFVNRLWKQFFGTGISAQVDDLGAQGEWPVHPELLDWLASEFRDSGWDVKHMVTLMVTSHAYRQQVVSRPELRELDPNNRWVAGQSPRRLDAEFVRDNALAVAGLIDLEPGGPPAWPYQPTGYYTNLQFPDRNYVADPDRRQYRRGLYAHWQRTFLHPMLAAFDAPSREDCVASRTSANSPQQALTLLNDPTFVEAARAFAASLLQGGTGDDSDRLETAYQRALARSVKPRERESLLALLGKVREAYRAAPDDARKLLGVGIAPTPAGIEPSELAAWSQVCRVVLNLHETITRY